MATFLALQCYQCNTMQAKQQQKKRSGKWTCAICNEKQSVIKVFARSNFAKDIRHFVQDFNMSAHLALQTIPQNILQEEEGKNPWDNSFAYESKWSEYLEDEEENTMPSPIADDDMPIVTALPDDPPFGKRKRQLIRVTEEFNLNGSSTLDNYGVEVANKKKAQSLSRPSGNKVASIIGRMKKSGSSAHQEEGRRRTAQDCGKQASKWSSYLEGEVETQNDGMVSRFVDNENNGSNFEGIFELQDQVIDEDVHPDFL